MGGEFGETRISILMLQGHDYFWEIISGCFKDFGSQDSILQKIQLCLRNYAGRFQEIPKRRLEALAGMVLPPN